MTIGFTSGERIWMVDLPFRVDFCMVKLAIPSRSSGSSCWVETKFPEGVEYGGIVSLVIRKLSVRLKHMRMTANDHINTLLHQKSGPLFLVFIWHGFIFCSPVSHKDEQSLISLAFWIIVVILSLSKISIMYSYPSPAPELLVPYV